MTGENSPNDGPANWLERVRVHEIGPLSMDIREVREYNEFWLVAPTPVADPQTLRTNEEARVIEDVGPEPV